MKFSPALALIGAALTMTSLTFAAGSTGNAFYGDPPDDHHPWAVHDPNRPQPKLVTPGTYSTQEQPGKPPSDAIVLFDGTAESLAANWEADKKESEPTKWAVRDGAMECVPKSGYVRTKAQFGDCQLHVEWAAPTPAQGESQGRGNSGVFLMGQVEIQVLDNYDNPTYADGFASSVYGVQPPLANALREPGKWQVYDIIFRRPIWKDGKEIDPGHVTVFCNGVLTLDHTQLEGPSGHRKRSIPAAFPDKGAFKLQDHGNPVRYRNIWYRELPLRAVEGGTDGPLTAEATAAKRKEIAAAIREDAAKHSGEPLPYMLRVMESLVYEKDEPTLQKATELAEKYAADLKQLPEDKLEPKKDEVIKVNEALQFLSTKCNIFPANFGPKVDVQKIIKAHGWDKKKK
jgi:Domain of Unknown Function (DUF1080)